MHFRLAFQTTDHSNFWYSLSYKGHIILSMCADNTIKTRAHRDTRKGAHKHECTYLAVTSGVESSPRTAQKTWDASRFSSCVEEIANNEYFARTMVPVKATWQCTCTIAKYLIAWRHISFSFISPASLLSPVLSPVLSPNQFCFRKSTKASLCLGLSAVS